MATLAATTTAELITHLGTAVSGDVITLAGGNYAGLYYNTAKTWSKTNPVIIRALTPANPPVFRAVNTTTSKWLMEIGNVTGLTLDGIVFNGIDYNNGYGFSSQKGLHLKTGCHGITIQNCLFTRLLVGFGVDEGTVKYTDITVRRNEFSQTSMDNLNIFKGIDRYLCEHNWCHNSRIDTAVRVATDDPMGRHHNSGNHPDDHQRGSNGNDLAGSDWIIRNNRFEGNQTFDHYMHGIFLFSERVHKNGVTDEGAFLQNVSITNNYILSGHTNALALCGVHGNVVCSRNVIRQYPGTPNGSTIPDASGALGDWRPRLNIYKGVGTTSQKALVHDNVWAEKDPGAMPGATLAGIDFGTDAANTSNVKSATAFPRGWVNHPYGRYSDTPTDEDAPTAPNAVYTTMGNVYDAGQIVFADGTSQGWSGTIVVTDDDDGHTAVPADMLYQWRSPANGVNSWKPTRVGTPATNAAGSNRYEMRPDFTAPDPAFPEAHRLHARKGGSIVMGDIRVRRKPKNGTIWSAEGTGILSFTTPALGTAPNVSAVTLSNSAYTIGQTVTANFAYTLGTGTFTGLLLEWVLGSTVVSSQTLANGVTTATTTASAAGSLSARVTLSTSVAPASVRSSVAATVTAAPVPPDVTAVTLNKSAYVEGEIATAAPTYTAGNGTGLGITYQWNRNASNIGGATAASYTTTATDVGTDLTCTVTATSSAGSDSFTSAASSVAEANDEPDPLTATEWEIAGVVSAPGLQNRFTAQWRMLITDTAVTGADWTTATVWRPCIQRGVDAQGRKLWELAPSATTGDQSHTVGYDETSAPILVRISTATGTSDATAAGKTFTGPEQPVDPPDDKLPAPLPSDWTLTPTPVSLPGRFAGMIAIGGIIDAAQVQSLEWTGPDSAWRSTSKTGDNTWRMEPLVPGSTEHLVAYGETRTDIRIRYTKTEGTSDASQTKSLSAPTAPTPEIDEGSAVDGILIAGVQVKGCNLVRPSLPGEVTAYIDLADSEYFIVSPLAVPNGAAYLVGSYAGRTVNLTGSSWREKIVPGQSQGVISGVSTDGVPSVSRVFNII